MQMLGVSIDMEVQEINVPPPRTKTKPLSPYVYRRAGLSPAT